MDWIMAYETVLLQLHSLVNKERTARERVERNYRAYQLAKKQFEKESEDVEKLSEESIATYLTKLFGQYDNRMNKEVAEQIASKMDLSKARRIWKQSKIEHSIALENLEEKQKEADDIKQQIKQSNCDASIKQSTKTLQSRVLLSQELTETTEAIVAGEECVEQVQIIIERVKEDIKISKGGSYQEGSVAMDASQIRKIEQAEETFNRLDTLLRRFEKELSDLDQIYDLNLESIDFTRKAFDSFFDNIFMTPDIKSIMQQCLDDLLKLEKELEKIILMLDIKSSDIEKVLEMDLLDHH